MPEPIRIEFYDPLDPPKPGEAKLRIKSGGSIDTTHVVVVDEHGVERELVGVTGVTFTVTLNDLARAEIGILAPEIDVDAPLADAQARALVSRDVDAENLTKFQRVKALLGADKPLTVRVVDGAEADAK